MDVFGNDIDVGDEVVYAEGKHILALGVVTGITEGIRHPYEVKLLEDLWSGRVIDCNGDSLVVNLEKKYKEKALLYHSEGV